METYQKRWQTIAKSTIGRESRDQLWKLIHKIMDLPIFHSELHGWRNRNKVVPTHLAESYLGCVKVTKNTAHRRVGDGIFLWSPDWSSSWPGSYWWLPCFRTSQAGSLRRSTLSQQKRAASTVERHHFNWNCGKLTMHVIAVLVLSVL